MHNKFCSRTAKRLFIYWWLTDKLFSITNTRIGIKFWHILVCFNLQRPKQFNPWMVITVIGGIVIAGAFTRCMFFHSVCNLKATWMNVQRSLIRKVLLYEFKLSHYETLTDCTALSQSQTGSNVCERVIHTPQRSITEPYLRNNSPTTSSDSDVRLWDRQQNVNHENFRSRWERRSNTSLGDFFTSVIDWFQRHINLSRFFVPKG